MTTLKKQYNGAYALIFIMLMIWLNESLKDKATCGLPTTRKITLKDVL